MKNIVLKVHPEDNVIVALTDLKAGQEIEFGGKIFKLKSDVDAKHKFTEKRFD
jgi:altronate hydrolase